MLRLRKDTKVELISRVPLFSGCSKVDLSRVASIADELDLPVGKTLIREGERGREFFVLVDGEVEVRRGGDRVATLRNGDFFGEMALVSSKPRNATVVARTPLRVLVVTERDFRRLLSDYPQIQRKIMEALAERVAPGDGDV
jgi:CRP-like cAMP-binding protein